ncbi:MAG: hypothetical protein GX217_00080 [Clostridiaceae bacterium]|nr:hypothetical protein [Clostridiaceae bacterium]
MKDYELLDAIGGINPEYIDSAEKSIRKDKKHIWKKLLPIAACLCLVISAVILPSIFGGNAVNPEKYKYHISGAEMAMEWPWEYMNIAEKYTTVKFNNKEYGIKLSNPVSENVLGDPLGSCEATGVDSYTNKKYTETFKVYRINGVSEDRLIAAGTEGEFYVYMQNGISKPATFGDVWDLYGLDQNLTFNHFTINEGYDDKGEFELTDDAYIREILSGCRDAVLYDETDSFERSNRNYLTFTATSEALGAYKLAVYISEDGYFATNLFSYSHIYYIGADAAEKIISYAKNNSVETESIPYELMVPGMLTEINDDYVLIDDSALCNNEEDGTVYKIYTYDIRIRRCVEFGGIKVGDAVIVKYNGEISEKNEVNGAYSMYTGTLVDGDLQIPE